MKQYLVFAGYYYYPNGGFDDYQACFDSFKEAEEFAKTLKFDWYQIVNKKNGEMRDGDLNNRKE